MPWHRLSLPTPWVRRCPWEIHFLVILQLRSLAGIYLRLPLRAIHSQMPSPGSQENNLGLLSVLDRSYSLNML